MKKIGIRLARSLLSTITAAFCFEISVSGECTGISVAEISSASVLECFTS
jgi:hypothetical protein